MLGAFAPFLLTAQQEVEKCGVKQSVLHYMESNPEYIAGIQRAEEVAAKWRAEHPEGMKNDGEITIPVVFHVVYSENDESQNISDEVIYSQMEVLNNAYRNLDPNADQTREVFADLRADMKLNFALASVDPDGNATTGIVRVPTDKDSFDMFTEPDAWKHSETGGADAWDNDLYLNIWVAKITFFGIENALLGVATFPSTMSAEEGNAQPAPFDEDGLTLNYRHVGVTNDPEIAPNDQGKTAIHEIGHWLGLRHIWADEDDPFTGNPGDCSQDDYVYDTPMANQRSQQGCDLERNSCSNENEFSDGFWGELDPPDMVENYMDYSNDACMHMFTHGQKERAWSFMVTAREKLFGSEGRNGEHFNAYAIKTESTCLSSCDGSITATAYWGEAPYTYSIDGGAYSSNNVFEDVCTGMHQVLIKDNAGTIVEANVELKSNYLNPLIETSSVDASCGSCADGEASVALTNGTPDYSYSWSTNPVQTTATAVDLLPGTYTCVITDGCGEETSQDVTVGATGIQDLNKSIAIYPNPVDDRLFIDGVESGTYSILDAQGREVLKGEVANGIAIDTKELNAGMFILRVKTNSGVGSRVFLK